MADSFVSSNMEVENQNRERLRLQDSVAQWDSLSGAFVSGNYKVLLYVTDFKDPNLDVKTLSLSRGNHTHGQFPLKMNFVVLGSKIYGFGGTYDFAVGFSESGKCTTEILVCDLDKHRMTVDELVFENHEKSLIAMKPRPLIVPYNNDKIFIFSSFSSIWEIPDESYPYHIAEVFCPSQGLVEVIDTPFLTVDRTSFIPVIDSHLVVGKKLYLRLDNRRLGINFGHVYCLNMETHEWKVFIDDGHINKLAYWTRFAIWQKADGNVHDNLHIWFEREFLQFADSDYSSDDDDDCFDHADGSFSDLDDNPLADDGIAAECLKLADKGLKSKPRAIEPLLELANEYGLFRDTPILPSAQCEDKYCLKHLLNFERGPPLTWIHDRIRFCWSWTGGYVIPRLRTGDEKLCLDVENLDSDDHMVPLSLTPESTKMTDFLNEKDVTVVHGILAPLGENKYEYSLFVYCKSTPAQSDLYYESTTDQSYLYYPSCLLKFCKFRLVKGSVDAKYKLHILAEKKTVPTKNLDAMNLVSVFTPAGNVAEDYYTFLRLGHFI
ncbi:hypothetical protein LINPERHAP2_LOCUS41463 [Linum perenne]